MEDWAEIRRLRRAEGVPIKEIARRLGVARNTVRAALVSDEPPRYCRALTGSSVDAFEPQIRALLREFPTMPATVGSVRNFVCGGRRGLHGMGRGLEMITRDFTDGEQDEQEERCGAGCSGGRSGRRGGGS